ncbi:MAG: VOC family protein [Actinomycetota bacterium]
MLSDQTFAATLPAKDLERARRFYEEVLGFTPDWESPAGIRYKSGDGYFELYPTQFAGTAQHTLGGWKVDDLEAAMAELRGMGITFEEYDMPGLKTQNGIAEMGSERGAWFKDPEGNILSLYENPEV